MTPVQRRAAAVYLVETFDVSQRRVARLLGVSRSGLRYSAAPRPQDEPLIKEIRRLANRHPTYGCPMIHALLARDGWGDNYKRVERLWRELGLQRRPRRKPRRKSGPKPGTSLNSCVNRPARGKNDVWTCDFIATRTADGRPLKCLSLLDEYTRECLALRVASEMTGEDVRRIVTEVISERGAPNAVRSDNGSEFVCRALTERLIREGTEPIPVAPGSPWQNGYIESFHNTLRNDFLDRYEFESVAEARARAGWYRREYNTVRPHSSLGRATPQEFSAACDRRARKPKSGPKTD